MDQNKKNIRIIALLAAFAVLFVMLFSKAYISHHIHHECTGDECPICIVMAQCANNLKNIGTIAIFIAISLFLCSINQESRRCVNTAGFFDSLISQKVRMNN